MANVTSPATLALAPALSGAGSMQLHSGALAALGGLISGNLAKPAKVLTARAVSSVLVRIDFDAPIVVNDALKEPANWTLAGALASTNPPVIKSVDAPESATTRSIELIVGEMQDATGYTVAPNSGSITTADGVSILTTAAPFTGVGVVPALFSVVAQDLNSVWVKFSEVVQGTADVLNPATYVFDLGLTVLAVSDFDGQIVELKTSLQASGTLYTLTVTGVILDNAGNAFVSPGASPMLGFVEPFALPGVVREQDMYRFLLEAIRNEDQQDGNQFVERYLKGPQEIWQTITESIMKVPDLWSVTDAPDGALQFLKNILGWTKRYETITSRLDFDELRRLIASSVAFWKERGTDPAIRDIVTLVTGARFRSLDWFDFRWIVSETGLGLIDSPNDPWVVSDDSQYNVRVVDDGTLDRTLVIELARLTRPIGETVEISWISFLDQFEVDNDSAQWDSTLAPSLDVSDGRAKLTSGGAPELLFTLGSIGQDWTNYVLSLVFRCTTSCGIGFYTTDINDSYMVEITTTTGGFSPLGTINLRKIVGGVPTTIVATAPLPSGPTPIYDGVDYSLRIEITPENPGSLINRIRVFFDEVLAISATDSDHNEGGMVLAAFPGGAVEFSIVELFENPLESTTILPNS